MGGGVSAKGLLLILLRLVLAWVFIRAGLPKVGDPIGFAVSIEGYRVISGGLVLWVAAVLPWLELVIGIGILIPWIRRASAILMGTLLGTFVALHASAWARGLDVACGCFGDEGSSSDYHLLILRNLALLAAVLCILCLPNSNQAAPKPQNQPL
jgi:uncharacterized membrane protein YphA (DoxX/SURF4 family)